MPILNEIAKLNKVLILGFAREGQSTLNFLRSRFPYLQIDTADQKDGPDYLLHLKDYQIIIKSPGISPHKPEIVAAQKAGTVFTSHTQIFFENCPGKIIGVTGTKGKSTTASLIHHVLAANDCRSVLVGNIGRPALDFLPEITADTWVAMELSSYQLMNLNISPHIAVLQNIYPDHLDYHQSFQEYVEAKRNIARYQKPDDYFIYNNDFPLSAQTAEITPAKKIPFSLLDYDRTISAQLLGEHNKYNILPSVFVGKILGLSISQIYYAISTFKPLDTRLQPVAEVSGIRFFEDTLATIPEATIAALDALSPDVDTLIAGGYERKQNYLYLAQKILDSHIKTLIVFPATGPRIWEEIKNIQSKPSIIYHQAKSMSDAVKFAASHTSPGKICLLSPAAPSFTLFKDYRDEGRQYRDALLSAAGI